MKILDFGFLSLSLRDVVDISLVALLIYQLYKLVRGSLALNIMIGLILVYLLWIFVDTMHLQLLSRIFSQFIQVGVIALIIIFQPELRRFLLLLGRSSGFRNKKWFKRFLIPGFNPKPAEKLWIADLISACLFMAENKIGALICISRTAELQLFAQTGTFLEAKLSAKLLESIFSKESPLHDGAVIIENEQIKAANCVLPVSENPDLPTELGLRHRSAVGLSEVSDAVVVIISEETGNISLAFGGKLINAIAPSDLKEILLNKL